MAKATIIGIAVLAGSWLIFGLFVFQAVWSTAGEDVAMRLAPYGNAHLLEEADEGLYNPSLDPLFLLGIVVGVVVPFALAALVTRRLNRRAPTFVLAIGVFGLLVFDRWVLLGPVPSRMQVALVLEIVAAIGATVVTCRMREPSEKMAAAQQ
jgi:hypothetical protein